MALSIEKIEQIKELIYYLAQDVEDIHKKDYLKPAMISHIKRMTDAPEEDIARYVNIFFEDRNNKGPTEK